VLIDDAAELRRQVAFRDALRANAALHNEHANTHGGMRRRRPTADIRCIELIAQ
jgi:GrpB-like predicted nucleotidyltransferase (UPF0157 family)